MNQIKVCMIFLLLVFINGCASYETNKKSDMKVSSNEVHDILIKIKSQKSQDTEKRKQYIDKIVSLSNDAVDPLINELSNTDPEIQEEAAALLGIIANPKAVDPLINALNGGIKRKYIAAWSLSKILDPKAVPHLIKALEDDSFEVRKYAVKALISFGKYSVEPLIKEIKSSNPNVRAGAARVLGEISAREAVEPLLTIINDSNENVVISVTWAIGKLGDDRAVEPLIKLLSSKNKTIRINAARSLGIIGNKNAKDPLEKLLADDEEFVVREWAARALENVTGIRYKYRDEKGIMVEPYNLYR